MCVCGYSTQVHVAAVRGGPRLAGPGRLSWSAQAAKGGWNGLAGAGAELELELGGLPRLAGGELSRGRPVCMYECMNLWMYPCIQLLLTARCWNWTVSWTAIELK